MEQLITFLAVIFLLWAGYAVIPDFLVHRLGIDCWKRQYTAGAAITFDDGPDPEMTPQILDILDRYQARAMFFVVGDRAAKNPDLIKLILARGHKIGAHSQHHRHAWLTPPLATWREWEKCAAALEQLTGEPIACIRPPWGTFNLAVVCWSIIRKKRIVLWNEEGHDWQARRSPEEIVSRILKNTREGSIILLHDAGGEPGAPANTAIALDILCRRIMEDKKIPLVALEFPDWPYWRRLVFRAWEKWEHIYAHLYKVERINAANLFRLAKTRYRGPGIYAADGRLLAEKGDIVGEIHFDSARLQTNETGAWRAGAAALRSVKKSLPGLARYVEENSDYQDIKVFLGLTLIHQGAKGLGFEVQEVPGTLFNRAVSLIQKAIMLIYRPAGKKCRKKPPNESKLVWITRDNLLNMWRR